MVWLPELDGWEREGGHGKPAMELEGGGGKELEGGGGKNGGSGRLPETDAGGWRSSGGKGKSFCDAVGDGAGIGSSGNDVGSWRGSEGSGKPGGNETGGNGRLPFAEGEGPDVGRSGNGIRGLDGRPPCGGGRNGSSSGKGGKGGSLGAGWVAELGLMVSGFPPETKKQRELLLLNLNTCVELVSKHGA